ncbi:MAG TPA: hypothetical protein DDZ54_06445 [Erythrobacter sp.]|nr:hypothetical protein [Erythrobacter sp.]HBR82917.1 hypothetical protein [Erythrobacter sp.]
MREFRFRYLGACLDVGCAQRSSHQCGAEIAFGFEIDRLPLRRTRLLGSRLPDSLLYLRGQRFQAPKYLRNARAKFRVELIDDLWMLR